MSPPRLTSSEVKASAAASSKRSTARRRPPRKDKRARRKAKRNKWSRPKRILAALGAVAAGLVGGYFLSTTDPVQQTLLEVTLPLRHEDIIRQQAREKGVEAPLIAAIIDSESHFRDQTSSAGARGLMQITPTTAREIEKLSGGQNFQYDDLADPELNIRYGTFYIRHLLNVYDGNEVAAIAAYNAGPANVSEWGGADLGRGDIQFEETRDYVDKVIEKRDAYRQKYPEDLGL
ncbi:MAG: lytic transglycosylase domain-containing protein [Solirubrobacterales bacterium]